MKQNLYLSRVTDYVFLWFKHVKNVRLLAQDWHFSSM